MTSAAEILAELRQRGVAIRIDGDDICLRPKRALDEALLARVRQEKPAILAALRSRPATCSPECYQIDPGVWIHRPCAGCRTAAQRSRVPKSRDGASPPKPVPRPRDEATVCWHCEGQRTCGCIACCKNGPEASRAACVVCKGTGERRGWIQ